MNGLFLLEGLWMVSSSQSVVSKMVIRGQGTVCEEKIEKECKDVEMTWVSQRFLQKM
jgi:hypothetical protein